MEDGFHRRQPEFFLLYSSPEFSLVHVVRETSTTQVEQLTRVGEMIDHKDIGYSVPIEFVNQIAPDESRPPRYDIHTFALRKIALLNVTPGAALVAQTARIDWTAVPIIIHLSRILQS
jgi:hypothetical protein